MTRRQSLLTLAGAGASALGAAAKRPNIIFLLVDDLGWSDFGCYGNRVYETPNIDSLARESVRFTNAYAACPVCSPTRASIMTGKYPARLGLTDWIPGMKPRPNSRLLTPPVPEQLRLEEETIAESLKPFGYRTASIGKWHLGGQGFGPQNQGFDVNIAGNHMGNPGRYFGPFNFPNLQGGTKDDYITEKLTDAAESFMADCAGKTPFFLYLAEYAVHTPLQARKEAVDRYRRKFGEKVFPNATYAAMVESVDIALGRVRAKLRALGIEQDTAILVTSDNGGLIREGRAQVPVTDNHPLRAGKGHLFEGGIREPLLVHWPGVTRPGSICDVPVSSIDYLPTLMEMAGAQPPARPRIDGVSFVPVLRGARRLERDALFWHYPHYSPQGGVPASAIRQDRWKLIEFFEDGRIELFDLEEDPGESRHLILREPKLAASLHARLREWRRSAGAVLPKPNPAFNPNAAHEEPAGAEPPTPPAR